MTFTDKDLQKIIGGVLKYGVYTVLTIGIIGGIIFLTSHGHETVNYSKFVENDRSIFEVISTIFRGVVELKGSSIIFLGILILFLTPFLRLVLSLVSFILEKDKLYVIITLIVLFIISMSVFFGFSH
ncbi:DUF1634 domain-containing protein [Chishuiella sp.]|uniref:DUF1634 domain-containing protein n=1 Tax=Chishuiella sp. TaxID=1969467 RepID=UPI0028B208E5|nr:DUF1634 domain-containing protein [Chishuiella sp.]